MPVGITTQSVKGALAHYSLFRSALIMSLTKYKLRSALAIPDVVLVSRKKIAKAELSKEPQSAQRFLTQNADNDWTLCDGHC